MSEDGHIIYACLVGLTGDVLRQMAQKCETFREKLEEFARKHKQDIIRNPDFRSKFNAMCSSIGVDPLNCERPTPLWFLLAQFALPYLHA